MIDYFEKANQICRCSRCEKSIKKGEYRGIELYKFNFRPAKRYYCVKCSEKVINEAKRELTKLTEELLVSVKKFGIK